MKHVLFSTASDSRPLPQQAMFHDLSIPLAQMEAFPRSDYAVVIPAYNEGMTIRQLTLQTLRYVSKVIVVDDGSVDQTASAVEDLPITIVRHSQNMGKAASLWRGFQNALDCDVNGVISLDGDGQHSPEDIPRLLEQAQEHPNAIIIGTRKGGWDWNTWHRRLANKIADFWISWAAGYAIADSQSGFRVYPSPLLRMTKCKHDRKHSFVFESEILIEGGKLDYQSYPVFIESKTRTVFRHSHFCPMMDIFRITKMVTRELLSRKMYLAGLYQSLRMRSRVRRETVAPPVPPH